MNSLIYRLIVVTNSKLYIFSKLNNFKIKTEKFGFKQTFGKFV